MASDNPAEARVTQRIGETIKARIASGLLGPGDRLPSTRALAAEWGISRTTVTAAYEQLIAEGYVETRPGARAEVARGLGLSSAPPARPASATAPGRLSAFGERLAGFALPPAAPTPSPVADFRYGDLSAADFPALA